MPPRRPTPDSTPARARRQLRRGLVVLIGVLVALWLAHRFVFSTLLVPRF